MATATAIEGMRSSDPVSYTRATEDSFGFCPSFENSSIYFAWRKR